MVDPESIPKLLAAGTIEVAPLAYMRGRTLNDSFIVLDEAQNTSPEQMKMFLTRLGFGSKIVVTGDVTQVDLPSGIHSGLRVVEGILDDVDDITFNRLTAHDVVRHRLVGKIVEAYDEFDARRSSASRGRTTGRSMSIEVLNESGQPAGRQPPRRAEPVRARPDAGAPARRAVHQGGRRGHDDRAQREVDGGRGPDRRARLPDGRAAPGLVNEEPEEGILGDLMLCPSVAERQATTAGHSTDAELELLTVHGILHLLGYDHAEPEEHQEMFGLQDRLLGEWRASAGADEPPGRRPGRGLVLLAGLFSAADAALDVVLPRPRRGAARPRARPARAGWSRCWPTPRRT